VGFPAELDEEDPDDPPQVPSHWKAIAIGALVILFALLLAVIAQGLR
jgi:hypothetical protein